MEILKKKNEDFKKLREEKIQSFSIINFMILNVSLSIFVMSVNFPSLCDLCKHLKIIFTIFTLQK